MTNESKLNFSTGHKGLIAIDKIGNQILFLDPNNFDLVHMIDGVAPRVHDLLISGDHAKAYVPMYGDGIHGNNPHQAIS